MSDNRINYSLYGLSGINSKLYVDKENKVF